MAIAAYLHGGPLDGDEIAISFALPEMRFPSLDDDIAAYDSADDDVPPGDVGLAYEVYRLVDQPTPETAEYEYKERVVGTY